MVAESTLISSIGMIISTEISPTSFKQSQSFLLYDPFTPSDQVGEIYIKPNHELMNKRVKKEALEHAFVLIIQTLVIAILMLILVRRVLTKPIQSIAANLHRTVPGDDNYLDCPKGHESDEIGNLVLDINKLLESARSTIKQERQLRNCIENIEKHFRLIFERSSTGVFLLDDRLRFASANQAFKNIAAIAMEERRANKQNIFLPTLFYDPKVVTDLLQDALNSGREQPAIFD